MKQGLLLFSTTRKVIKAEKILIQNNFAVTVIPVPKHITSECGMSLVVGKDRVQPAVSLLAQHNISVKTEIIEKK